MANTLNTLLPTILLMLALIVGCSKGAISEQQLIYILPDVLDFGQARPTDSPIKLTFDIRNDSSKSVVITDIIAGCSCTVVNIPNEPIPPNGKVTVTVSINIWGRSGVFEDSLVVRTSETSTLRVPIQGTIETDIWTAGQALRATIGPTEEHVSAVLTVYTKYPDIGFVDGQQAHGVRLTEISRVTQSDETAIRFMVDVDVEPNSAVMRMIRIIPDDSSIAPLEVPFYVHRLE